jgi:hypothetical protein
MVPSQVEMRLFRPLMDRAGSPKWLPLDFLLYVSLLKPDSAGVDPLHVGKRDFYLGTTCNKQFVYESHIQCRLEMPRTATSEERLSKQRHCAV